MSVEKVHIGPIHSPVAGRTDHLPMHVPSGAYVLPADIVSSMGEGNTMAGFKISNRLFGQQQMPEGEVVAVPIVAAGGEYVISPVNIIQRVGEGDLDRGHQELDQFVVKLRARTVKTLSNLPGPKKD